MEGVRPECPICHHISTCLRHEPFTLIDVGCSTGIASGFRSFGKRLRAIGFDPNLKEIERLQQEEPLSGVTYVAGFVGLPADHPIAQRRQPGAYWRRDPWKRFSVARTLERTEAAVVARGDQQEITEHNLWQRTDLADTRRPIVLPDYLEQHDIHDIDFLKIDIDGPDFDVLRGLHAVLGRPTVLGLGMEVNFYGSADDDHHTFHHTDRFLRSLGFDLFALTALRSYSSRVLPAVYVGNHPAETLGGRLYQGDALYVRDVCSVEMRRVAEDLSPEKLAKAAALFSLFGLHDQAAEVVVSFRTRLEQLLDTERLLDLLAEAIQKDRPSKLTYSEYLAAFDRDDPSFYRGLSEPEPLSVRAAEKQARHLAVLLGDERAEHLKVLSVWQSLDASYRALQTELGDTQAHNRSLVGELQAMQRSRSWRMTAPLRGLGHRLRRLAAATPSRNARRRASRPEP